ncbi:hypothetical protein HOE22_00495, partial [Candidatus Woesearchaeota archaeon]|nr:hypothetical protein [Candidatus Woesearchaeota archaeon]
MINKKGQAAMEFLMTYGWALLVVLIAIGALASFGVLNPGQFLPETCTVAPGISCIDFSASASGSPTTVGLTVMMQNGMGIALTAVTLDSPAFECTLNPVGDWAAGEVVTFECEGSVGTEGAMYSGTEDGLTLDYTVSGGLAHSKAVS